MSGPAEPVTADSAGLTPVAEDYLKAIWSATEWGQPPITVSGLAIRFGTSRPTASATVKRLGEQGLLRHAPYQDIELTDTGVRLAVAMVRRHRLTETFLAEQLDYNWDEVHEEAERLEHAVSDIFLARIDALLGHPTADPHGDPVPSADGTVGYAHTAVTLDAAGHGDYTVLRVSDRDPALLRRAHDADLTPGALLTLDQRNGPRLRVLLGPDTVILTPADRSAVTV